MTCIFGGGGGGDLICGRANLYLEFYGIVTHPIPF